MTQSVPPDGLSAYFDEELSSAERDAIAQHLTQSTAAQRELAEIRRVSAELRQLPGESAPCTLLSGVMQRMTNAKTPTTVASTKSSLAKRGTWAALTVVALVLVAWLPSFWQAPQTHTEQPELAMSPTPELERADQIPAELSLPGDNRRKKVILGSEDQFIAESRNFKTLEKRGGPVGNATPAEVGGFSDISAPDAMMLPGVADEKLPTNPQDATADNGLSLDELLQWAQSQQDQVIVVEVKTDNVQKSLAQWQLYLAQQKVRPANSTGQNRKAADPQDDPRQQAGQSFDQALFVQATPQQLSNAFAKLHTQQAAAQFQPKINVALKDIPIDLDGATEDRGPAGRFRQSLAQSVDKYEAAQGFGGGGLATQRTMRAGSDPAKKQESAETKPGDAKPQFSAAGIDLDNLVVPNSVPQTTLATPSPPSFQMLVQTPSDYWRKTSTADSEQVTAAEEPKTEPLPAEEAKDPEDKPAPPTTVRLLFLFRQ